MRIVLLWMSFWVMLLGAKVVHATDSAAVREFYAYGFGGLETQAVENVVGLLTSLDYAGVAVQARDDADRARLKQYLSWEERLGDKFSVAATFMHHRFDQHGFSIADHKATIDLLAGKKKQLWVWFRDPSGTVSQAKLESFIREILNYAAAKGVTLVLYPHVDNMIATAQQAFDWAARINHPSLGIAFNLTHELNAGKGAEVPQTFSRVKSRVVAVTISGSNTRTHILSLDESTYDLRPYLRAIKESGYQGPVGFLNFKLTNPASYLERSFTRWQALAREVGLYASQPGGGSNPGAGGGTDSPRPDPDNGKNTLKPNQALNLGGMLQSANGRYRFTFQKDGNLVLRDASTNAVKWAAGTHGKGGSRLIMQSDGNLVLRAASGAAVWSSGTYGRADSRLVLNNSGLLAIYFNEQAVWKQNSGTTP